MTSAADERPHTIAEGDAGQRLDRYLRKLCADVPLSALHRWLRTRVITVDGARAEPGLRLEPGMRLLFRGASARTLGKARGIARESEAGDAAHALRLWTGPEPRVLHHDADVLAVDKPSGLAVQPGVVPSLVDWLRTRRDLMPTAPSRTFRPAPAHRIDRATSGVVLIGLSGNGLRGLTAAFRDGTVEKVYLALVRGVPSAATGTIDAPLAIKGNARPSRAKATVDAGGLTAHTTWEIVARHGGDAVLRVRIETGRTHQIRAHLAHIGYPLRGDRRYGGGDGTFVLHAVEIALVHPITGAPLRVAAPLPRALAHILAT